MTEPLEARLLRLSAEGRAVLSVSPLLLGTLRHALAGTTGLREKWVTEAVEELLKDADVKVDGTLPALCRVVEVARLPRNTRGTDIVEPGWVAVPVDDFDRLRAAIRALDEKGGAA